MREFSKRNHCFDPSLNQGKKKEVLKEKPLF